MARKSSPKSVAVPESQYASVSVRKIDNGYIVSESMNGPRGYKCTERFSPTKPKITMPTASAPKKR